MLLQGYLDGNECLNEWLRTREGLRTEARSTYQAAAAAVEELAQFAGTGSLQAASQAVEAVEQRHAADGPEDRRKRPWWAVALLWPAIIASATYDTLFLGDILQRMMSVGSDSAGYYLAYLPGFGIMVGLMVTGHLLGEAAARDAARRRLGSSDGRQQLRSPNGDQQVCDLPQSRWVVPIVFTVAFLGTLLIWAYIRSLLAGAANRQLAGYEPQMALLLMMLTIAAVALKVITHNPYAGSARRARLDLKRACQTRDRLLKRARKRMTAHHATVTRLDGGTSHADEQARGIVVAAARDILRARACQANPDNPLLIADIPPAALGGQQGSEGPEGPLETHLAALAAWRLHTEELFGDEWRTFDSCQVDELDTQFNQVVESLRRQLGRSASL